MKINRKELVGRHNPMSYDVDVVSPLTVGNGDFGFTFDVTGMQTLYDTYYDTLPLCTMTGWGWHTHLLDNGRKKYTLDDLVMTKYDYCGREVIYPKKAFEGNEEVYNWLRHNPHRVNMARIGMLYKNKPIEKNDITNINQELRLYTGIANSDFTLYNNKINVQTASSFESENVGFIISAEKSVLEDIQVKIEVPYGSSDISGSNWDEDKGTFTSILETSNNIILKRAMDDLVYYIKVSCSQIAKYELLNRGIVLYFKADSNCVDLSVSFSNTIEEAFMKQSADKVFSSSINGWFDFWEKGGIVELWNSEDERAKELERRIILSQYLLIVNSAGSRPPQETGMTCNSWYGKCHLEMILWHNAWLGLWGHEDRLEKNLDWYIKNLDKAIDNAQRNGYKGARWPKMVADDCIDSPSTIAPLLIWQQPHIIYMLYLIYNSKKDKALIEKFWNVIFESAEFMADFVVWDEKKNSYNLMPPLIAVQERFTPESTKNPTFELEYFKVGLQLASEFAREIGKSDCSKKWIDISDKIQKPFINEGMYQANDFEEDTFTNQNDDHPSMVGMLGLLSGKEIDKEVMNKTIDKIVDCWQYKSLWGWDFALMAMTFVRLGRPLDAIDILLKDSEKNQYVKSGNNFQGYRKDLPLYLPGNGGLLLTVAMMCAGYEGCDNELVGFPSEKWDVKFENINKIL